MYMRALDTIIQALNYSFKTRITKLGGFISKKGGKDYRAKASCSECFSGHNPGTASDQGKRQRTSLSAELVQEGDTLQCWGHCY